MRQHGIDNQRELVVRIERNMMAESMNRLVHQPPNDLVVTGRRASIASTNVFAIGNTIREAGFDYFVPIPRSNQVNLGERTAVLDVVTPAPASVASALENDEYTNSNEFLDEIDGTNDNIGAMVDVSENETIAMVDNDWKLDQFIDDADDGEDWGRLDDNVLIDGEAMVDVGNNQTVAVVDYDPDCQLDPIDVGGEESVAMVDDNEYWNLDRLFAESHTIALEIEPIQYCDEANVDDEVNDGVEANAVGEENADDEANADNEANAGGEADTGGEATKTLNAETEEEKEFSSSLFNDFQPFERLASVPFSMAGRPRAMSIDSYSNQPAKIRPRSRRSSILAVPKLETVVKETIDDILADVQNLF